MAYSYGHTSVSPPSMRSERIAYPPKRANYHNEKSPPSKYGEHPMPYGKGAKYKGKGKYKEMEPNSVKSKEKIASPPKKAQYHKPGRKGKVSADMDNYSHESEQPHNPGTHKSMYSSGSHMKYPKGKYPKDKKMSHNPGSSHGSY